VGWYNMQTDKTTLKIRPELVELFEDIFEDYEGEINADTSPDNVPGWDSLKQIALVNGIEQSFGISLSMDEMHEIQSVGDIEKILDRHGA